MIYSVVGTSVGQLTASDYDRDAFAFTLLVTYPAVPFFVTREGAVLVAGPLDFEAGASYTLLVAVNETGNGRGCSLSDATTVTVGLACNSYVRCSASFRVSATACDNVCRSACVARCLWRMLLKLPCSWRHPPLPSCKRRP